MPLRSGSVLWLACSALLAAACGNASESSPPPAAPTSSAAPAAAGSPTAPHIKGKMPPQDVQQVVRAQLFKVQACYEKGLNKNPQLAGKLVYQFVIGPDGKVSSIADQGSTMPDPEVIECGKGVFAALQFKSPEDGGTVTVTYPVELKPKLRAPRPAGVTDQGNRNQSAVRKGHGPLERRAL